MSQEPSAERVELDRDPDPDPHGDDQRGRPSVTRLERSLATTPRTLLPLSFSILVSDTFTVHFVPAEPTQASPKVTLPFTPLAGPICEAWGGSGGGGGGLFSDVIEQLDSHRGRARRPRIVCRRRRQRVRSGRQRHARRPRAIGGDGSRHGHILVTEAIRRRRGAARDGHGRRAHRRAARRRADGRPTAPCRPISLRSERARLASESE